MLILERQPFLNTLSIIIVLHLVQPQLFEFWIFLYSILTDFIADPPILTYIKQMATPVLQQRVFFFFLTQSSSI